jgi:hypothetical protein
VTAYFSAIAAVAGKGAGGGGGGGGGRGPRGGRRGAGGLSQKMFTRKENLDRHERKHNNDSFFP